METRVEEDLGADEVVYERPEEDEEMLLPTDGSEPREPWREPRRVILKGAVKVSKTEE